MNAAAATRPVRVVLADDHDLVRSGIKALLSMIKDVEVIAEARNGQELITLAEELMPEVVMTDISMPGMDGIAAIAHLSKSRSQVRLLMLSMSRMASTCCNLARVVLSCCWSSLVLESFLGRLMAGGCGGGR